MRTPHLKPLKKGIAHGRNSYSGSEKSEYSKETPVFAYMRRSTSKIEQEDSLEKQEDCIDVIAQDHRIDESHIIAFTETRSGFENRKRPRFNEMIKAIDKLKVPCILLAYDSSRLSRNQKDSREIVDRIFGDNGAKSNIQEVIFFEDRSWNKRSNKDEVYQTLLDNYKESVHTGKRSRDGSLKQLRNGIYTWTPPRGLEHVKKDGKILYMKQNEKMPIVRKAFEMKMAGTTHKKISKYLRENNIKIGERELTERYFGNTIYIGVYQYTNTATGEVKDYPVKFFEGKPPISMSLWQGVQENRGKKKDNYGDKQGYFALGEVLRTEEGRRLSGYFQKGTAQYKNTTEGIHISERKIINDFLDALQLMFLDTVYHYTLVRNIRFQSLTDEELKKIVTATANKIIEELVKRIKILHSPDEAHKKEELLKLEKQKKQIIEEKKRTMKNFLNANNIQGLEDVLQEELVTYTQREQILEEQIQELENTTDIDVFCERLPDVLLNTFELLGKVLGKRKNTPNNDDVYDVIKLLAFELKIKSKKALEIELFGPVRQVLDVDYVDLEAPPGVEPGYEALQAPV